jgi:formylglycine-generating enzyme required for sulfatase activity
MAGNIFISYRREDAAGSAALLYEHLSRAFGESNVFMDVDNVMAGQRFDQQLERALAECQIFIAVIGPRWLDLLKSKRVARERDYVHEEIAAALARGVVVIPVTVDRGTLPQQKDLPKEIQALVFHQQHIISQEQRRRDIAALVTAIRANRKSPEIVSSLPWNWIAFGGAGLVVAVIAITILFSGPPQPSLPQANVMPRPSASTTVPTVFASNTARSSAPSSARRDDPSQIVPGSGRSFRDTAASDQPCPICPEMVVVPAGGFLMGSPHNEPGREPTEGQVGVTFARSFAVGKYAVTFEEWDACVADGGCKGYRPNDQGWGRERQPVINVSWDDVDWYIAWLKQKTGKSYRLLSEAEREYATRAGKSSPFWWGTSITPRQANYDGSTVYQGGGAAGEYRQKTLAVDSFGANPWGLYNVHGNLWEWTADCWSSVNNGYPSDGGPRIDGAEDCDRRVKRGGAWDSEPKLLRAASRARSEQGLRTTDIGFRVARQLSP